MRGRYMGVLVMFLLGCGVEFRLKDTDGDGGASAGGRGGSGGDAGGAGPTVGPGGTGGMNAGGMGPGGMGGAESLGPWQVIGPVGELNTSDKNEDDPTLPDSMLEIFFERDGDIFTATRPSVMTSWSEPVVIENLSAEMVTSPEIAPNGLTLWFAHEEFEGTGDFDIFVTKRDNALMPWSTPVAAQELNSGFGDYHGNVSPDERLMIFVSRRAAPNDSSDLFYATRPNNTSPWSGVTALAELNVAAASDTEPHLSANSLTLWFTSNRNDPNLLAKMYVTHRAQATDVWNAAQPVAELNAPNTSNSDPWVSPNGKVMFFARRLNGTTGHDIFMATRD